MTVEDCGKKILTIFVFSFVFFRSDERGPMRGRRECCLEIYERVLIARGAHSGLAESRASLGAMAMPASASATGAALWASATVSNVGRPSPSLASGFWASDWCLDSYMVKDFSSALLLLQQLCKLGSRHVAHSCGQHLGRPRRQLASRWLDC